VLFPNPAQGTINLGLNEVPERLRVLDALGRVVMDQRTASAFNTLRISDLPANCYALQALVSGQVIWAGHFVKE
jgi:hypothetical protein